MAASSRAICSPIYLKPVSTRRSSTPYLLATAVTMSVETIVVTATGFSGIVPLAMLLRQMKSLETEATS